MEILLKTSTKITKSPKKINTTNMKTQGEPILLSELEEKDEYEKVSTKVKVIEHLQTITVPTGKRVQEILVGDSSTVTKCSLWEQDIDTLSVGSCYLLKIFQVHEFASKKFVSKAKEGSEAIPIPDIGNIVNRPTQVQDEQITNAQIIAVPQLTKHKSCLRCKARVEPGEPPFGSCSKEDCQMFQRYDICKLQLSVKLLFLVDNGQIALYAYGQTVLDIAGTEDIDDYRRTIPPNTAFFIRFI